MVLHPLFAYPTLILALVVFGLQIVSILKSRSAIRYALYLNGLLIVFALLSVVFWLWRFQRSFGAVKGALYLGLST